MRGGTVVLLEGFDELEYLKALRSTPPSLIVTHIDLLMKLYSPVCGNGDSYELITAPSLEALAAARQPDELVGAASGIVKAGLAGREHDKARPAEALLVVEQGTDGQRRIALHDQARAASVVPVELAVAREVPVALTLRPTPFRLPT